MRSARSSRFAKWASRRPTPSRPGTTKSCSACDDDGRFALRGLIPQGRLHLGMPGKLLSNIVENFPGRSEPHDAAVLPALRRRQWSRWPKTRRHSRSVTAMANMMTVSALAPGRGRSRRTHEGVAQATGRRSSRYTQAGSTSTIWRARPPRARSTQTIAATTIGW